MVLNVIQEMALAARLPVPKAYFIPDSAPNAFATGRDPEHSLICVTQGLIDNMDREEIQGVIGHEMSHIADYDIRTMMMVAVLVGGIAMLSDFMVRASFFRSNDRDSDRNGGGISLLIDFCAGDRGAVPLAARRDGGFARARVPRRCLVGRVHAQSARAAARSAAHRGDRVAIERRYARHRASVHREPARSRCRR